MDIDIYYRQCRTSRTHRAAERVGNLVALLVIAGLLIGIGYFAAGHLFE